jgi:hypothetical protein
VLFSPGRCRDRHSFSRWHTRNQQVRRAVSRQPWGLSGRAGKFLFKVLFNALERLCAVRPQPLAHNSVRYCERHLRIARLRHKPKNAKGELPGSIAWLYSDGEQFVGTAGSLVVSRRSLWHARSRRKRARANHLDCDCSRSVLARSILRTLFRSSG